MTDKQQIELMKMELQSLRASVNGTLDEWLARLEQMSPSKSEARFTKYRNADWKEKTKTW